MSQRHFVIVRDSDSTVHSSMTLPDGVEPPLQPGHSAHETPHPLALHGLVDSRLLWPSLESVAMVLPAAGQMRAARRIEELERQQARSLRELALSTDNGTRSAALARLQDIEASVAELRKRLP